jgi:hypothetical protein
VGGLFLIKLSYKKHLQKTSGTCNGNTRPIYNCSTAHDDVSMQSDTIYSRSD